MLVLGTSGHGETEEADVIKTVLAAIGGVTAALVSALCCAGPLVAVPSHRRTNSSPSWSE